MFYFCQPTAAGVVEQNYKAEKHKEAPCNFWGPWVPGAQALGSQGPWVPGPLSPRAPGPLGPSVPGPLGPWPPGPWAPNINAEEAPLHHQPIHHSGPNVYPSFNLLFIVSMYAALFSIYLSSFQGAYNCFGYVYPSLRCSYPCV